jgi:Uma2 family endonuclease
VAITSVDIDEQKADIYAEAGIPEYWVVRPEAREMDIYSGPSPEGYTSRITHKESETVRPISLPDVSFRLSEVLPPP